MTDSLTFEQELNYFTILKEIEIKFLIVVLRILFDN